MKKKEIDLDQENVYFFAMQDLYAPLKKLIQSTSGLPDSEWPYLEKHCYIKTHTKGEYILKSGDFNSHVGLVIKGLIKRSYIHENGKEFVHYFGNVGRFSGTYSSILNRQPSTVNIIALEDSELIMFDFYEYQKLYPRHIAWERFIRLVIEQLFVDREKREYELLMFSAEERYEAFKRNFAPIMTRLSNKDIASYLRITPEAFSRLKR